MMSQSGFSWAMRVNRTTVFAAGLAVVVALLFAASLTAKPAVAQETIVEDRNYTVEEFFAGVHTDLRIRRGDRVVFTASGTIWPAGRFNPFFPSTGPEGYPDSPDCGNPDSNWPAPCERKFSLLGRIDDQVAPRNEGWFYIGGGRELVYTATQQGFLDLNHNDDVSGNGEGAFEVNVKVYRDITPPNTTINSAPPSMTNSRQASFAFSSSEANSTFECRATRQGQAPAAFFACTSPRELTNLTDGSYAFEVRAKDAVGNVDGSPASHTWTVDTTKPAPPVISSPANNSYDHDGNLTVSGMAEANSSVALVEQLSGGAEDGRCTVTADASGNWSCPVIGSEGPHTYASRATDAAGNTSDVSGASTVTVDTTAPGGTVLINGGRAFTTRLAVTLTLRASDAGSGVGEMRVANTPAALSSAPWTTYTASKRWKLGGGGQRKTVYVQYKDRAGNVSAVVRDAIVYRR